MGDGAAKTSGSSHEDEALLAIASRALLLFAGVFLIVGGRHQVRDFSR